MWIKKLLNKLIEKYMVNQVNPHPILFFCVYMISLFDGQGQKNIISMLLLLSIISTLFFKYNFFYIINPINNTLGFFSPISLILGIISCNEKWKLYLFVFVIGDSLAINYQSQTIYRILFSFYLGYQTYKNLIFSTIQHNKIYFIGFMGIFSYFLVSYFLQIFNMNMTAINILAIPLSFVISHFIFQEMILKLLKQNIHEIKNPQIAYLFINLIEQKLKQLPNKYVTLQLHKSKCQQIYCPCKKVKHIAELSKQQLIQSLYQQILRKFKENQYFINKYIEKLIKDGKIINALLLIKNSNETYNYFEYVKKLQNIALSMNKINMVFKKIEQTTYFQQALVYDKKYHYLLSEIVKIIENKIQFWKQSALKQPLLIKLQEKGKTIVENMQRIHQFYCVQIKNIQNKIKNFNASIVYSMYLLATTNYQQYAESILKAIHKEIDLLKYSETQRQFFGIRVKVNQDFKSKFKQQKNKLFLSIEEISSSFCQLLQKNRNQIIGQNIEILIPQIYKAKYQQKKQQILSANILSTMLLEKSYIFPLKVNESQIVQVKITAKLYISKNNSINIILSVQVFTKSKQLYLTTFDKIQFLQSKQKTNQPSKQIYDIFSFNTLLQNQQFRKQIYLMSKQWLQSNKIEQKTIKTYLNSDEYTVQISSPFQNIYRNNQNPPLHIRTFSESAKQLKNNDGKKQKQIEKCVNKVQKVFITIQKNQSMASSNVSKTSNVVVSLLTFTESKSVSFFSSYSCLAFLIVVVCITLSILSLKILNLPWKDTKGSKNPIIFLMTLSKIQQISNDVVGGKYELDMFFKLKFDVSQFQLYNSLRYGQIKKQVTQNLVNPPQWLEEIVYKYTQTIIEVYNPISTSIKTQNLTLKNILNNYILDLYLLSLGKEIQNNFIQLTFLTSVSNKIKSLRNQIQLKMGQNFQTLRINNIIMLITLLISLKLLLIPICLMNSHNIIKIKQIYQLMVSIQSSYILSQINMLQNVLDIIKLSKNPANSPKIHSVRIIVNQTEKKNSPFKENMNDFIIQDDQKHKKLYLRKRQGQLNVKDIQKQSIGQNFLIYLIIFLFSFFIISTVMVKLNDLQLSYIYSNEVIKREKQLSFQNTLITNTKIYLYSQVNKTILLKEIKKSLENLNLQINNIENNDQAYIICPEYLYKIKLCNQKTQYTQTIITSMINSIIRQTIFANQSILQNPLQNFQLKFNILSISPLRLVKNQIVLLKNNQTINKMFNGQQQNKLRLNNLFITIIIYGAFSLVLIITIINKKKARYLTQLSIISFLNRTMISKHKRAQSFIKRLLKQNN